MSWPFHLNLHLCWIQFHNSGLTLCSCRDFQYIAYELIFEISLWSLGFALAHLLLLAAYTSWRGSAHVYLYTCVFAAIRKSHVPVLYIYRLTRHRSDQVMKNDEKHTRKLRQIKILKNKIYIHMYSILNSIAVYSVCVLVYDRYEDWTDGEDRRLKIQDRR